ncbi:guanylate kinase [Aneurinibacillus sp. Ricciae_BoGa-3]|uniref:guanylate kinase n=1 Tax=Aneurinibacillus sp. Ricciae_BoGa-3 TaxID=3022697 RepID=UPI002341269B|nr:guanylate kinase [Aneurinibacillus sp. Ricciae_BoGa-3]WCK56556.1 guanylate kinase [Aneurinibacillus sp. Ricciae_BoGa-3]
MSNVTDTPRIFVFSGPYGAGRKTIADMVAATVGMERIIPYTTRIRRSAEVDGQDYHFISREQFAEAKKKNEFVEILELDGILHGIKEQEVDDKLQKYGLVYMILNRYGADLMKEKYGDSLVRLFIHADVDTITKRQRQRGYSDDVIARQLIHYDHVMEYMHKCEHAFANGDIAHTAFAVSQVIESYLKRKFIETA